MLKSRFLSFFSFYSKRVWKILWKILPFYLNRANTIWGQKDGVFPISIPGYRFSVVLALLTVFDQDLFVMTERAERPGISVL